MDADVPIKRFFDYYSNKVVGREGRGRDGYRQTKGARGGRNPTLGYSDGQREMKRTRFNANEESNFPQNSPALGMTREAVLQCALQIIRDEKEKSGSYSEFNNERQRSFGQTSASRNRDNELYGNRGACNDEGSFDDQYINLQNNSRDLDTSGLSSVGNMNDYPASQIPGSWGNWANRGNDFIEQVRGTNRNIANRGNDFTEQGRGMDRNNANRNDFSNSPNQIRNLDRGNDSQFSIGNNQGMDSKRGQQKKKRFRKRKGKSQNSAVSEAHELANRDVFQKTEPFSRKRNSEGFTRDSGWKQPFPRMQGWPMDLNLLEEPQEDFSPHQSQFRDESFIQDRNFGRRQEDDSEEFLRNSGWKKSLMGMQNRPMMDLQSSIAGGYQDFSARQSRFQDDSFGSNRKFGAREEDFEEFLRNSGWKQSSLDMQVQPMMDLESALKGQYQDFPARQRRFQDDFFGGNRKFGGRRTSNFMRQENLEQKPLVGDNNTKLFIRGLAKTCSERQLLHYFSTYGDVVTVHIARDQRTQKSLQHGIVIFSEPYMVRKALSMAPHVIHDQRLQVSPYSFFSKKTFDRPFNNTKRPRSNVLPDASSTSKKKNASVMSKKKSASFTPKKKKNLKKKKKGIKPKVVKSQAEKIAEAEEKRVRVYIKRQTRILNKRASNNMRECSKPPGDPHIFCVFCRSSNMAILNACIDKPCLECSSLAQKELEKLKTEWRTTVNDNQHSCFWNMTAFDNVLEPSNVTSKSAYCNMCYKTFEVEILMKHLREANHLRTYQKRASLFTTIFNSDYQVYLKSHQKEKETEQLMKFCEACFLLYGDESAHQNGTMHKMITSCRSHRCEVCELENVSYYRKHCHQFDHLQNVWHQKVVSGKEETAYKDSEFFGADFVKKRPVAYCRVCRVVLEPNGVDMIEHCKTKEHFEKLKKRYETPFERKPRHRSLKKKLGEEMEAEAGVTENDAEGNKEVVEEENEGNGVVDDCSEGNDDTEDDAEGVEDDEESVEDCAEGNEDVGDAAAMEVEED